MRRLRFCFVTTFYPPHNFGGDGVFVERLAGALVRKGHHVEVLHAADAFEALASQGQRRTLPPEPDVDVRSLRAEPFPRTDLFARHQLGRPVALASQLRSLLAPGRHDVIHYHNISLVGGPDVLSYGNAIKICTLHDYWFVCPMHVLWRFDRERCSRRTCLPCTVAGGRPPQLWRYTGALPGAAAHVHAFLAPSETSRRLHSEHGFPAPIRVLPHFVPRPPEPRERDADPRPAQRPFFLYVGRLEKLKGIEHLVERFRSYRSADLVIAGSGSREAALRQAIRALPHVRMFGWVDAAGLDRLYREALAVVVPSLCFETFGLSAVEGFAAGAPAVVSAGGAAEELVGPTRAGIVYRSDEELIAALERLRTGPDLRRELGENARRAYEASYTEEKHLDAYFALIAELMAQKASPRSA